MFCSAVVLFFFNDTATTEIYTLSLHDALPISDWRCRYLGDPERYVQLADIVGARLSDRKPAGDRKSTRLNSSHLGISYAVFCLKKKIHWTLTNVPWRLSRSVRKI